MICTKINKYVEVLKISMLFFPTYMASYLKVAFNLLYQLIWLELRGKRSISSHSYSWISISLCFKQTWYRQLSYSWAVWQAEFFNKLLGQPKPAVCKTAQKCGSWRQCLQRAGISKSSLITGENNQYACAFSTYVYSHNTSNFELTHIWSMDC